MKKKTLILSLILIFQMFACQNNVELSYVNEDEIDISEDEIHFEKSEYIPKILEIPLLNDSIYAEYDDAVIQAREFPIIGDAQFVWEALVTFRESRDRSAIQNRVIPSRERLILENWRIESFEFLDELWEIEEFRNIKSLDFRNIYIPQGVRIQPSDVVDALVSISFRDIRGSGSADVLYDVLPLPNLWELSLSGDVLNENALPHIPSLIDLYIVTPDAIEIIQNNAHISGILHLGKTQFPLLWGSWGG